MLRTKRSAKAFKFGERDDSRTNSTPPAWRIMQKSSLNWLTRSCRRYRHPFKKPALPSAKFRATGFIRSPLGSGTMPVMISDSLVGDDAILTPAWILTGDFEDQFVNCDRDGRTARFGLPVAGKIPHVGDPLAMPLEQGFGLYNRDDVV